MPSRFYLPASQWGDCQLTGEEARHAIKVLRVRIGEEISLFDGAGRVADAVVTTNTGKVLSFKQQSESYVEPISPAITLFQAVPKGKNMDLIVQKAVELGVSAIQPLITENTVAASEATQKKAEKWQRIAMEAAKQCKQAWMPEVREPIKFSEVSDWGTGLKLVASLRDNAKDMKTALSELNQPQEVSLLVGPEGDFAPLELDHAESEGFIPISMGELVLRVETATLYGLSALRFHYGNS